MALDFLNDPRVPAYCVALFRERCVMFNKFSKHPAATEISLIDRFLSGETSLTPGLDFHPDNLELVKYVRERIAQNNPL